MLFNSLDYFVFLTLALTAYWALWRHNLLRLAFLAVASWVFYMSWHPAYILLLLASTVLDYTVGLRIHRAISPRARKVWLGVSIAGNLGMLFTFKYFNFFSASVVAAFHTLGFKLATPQLNVLLPAGISFYTFQTLAYSIDVYRGHITPTRNWWRFAAFTSYFPQLVAGPIVRASQLLPQLEGRPRLEVGQASRGLFLIATGLVKKVAIADYLSLNLVDRIFDSPEAYTATEVMVALYGFTMQLYCDFSGYTDVARGSALLMGLQLPENFDRPYQASHPGEFWRRWHMSLSTWIRDYLYFPLGGSRVSAPRAYFNLWLTLFLMGLWHGASWNFVLYGAVQGTAMVLHRFFLRRSSRSAVTVDPLGWHCLKVFACLQFVVLSRLLFRSADLGNAWEVTRRLWSGTSSTAQVSAGVWCLLIGAFAAHYSPRAWYAALEQRFVTSPWWSQGVLLALLGAALSRIASAQVVPYIYWQF